MAKVTLKRKGGFHATEFEVTINGHKIDGVRKYTLREEAAESVPVPRLEIEAWEEMNIDLETELDVENITVKLIGDNDGQEERSERQRA